MEKDPYRLDDSSLEGNTGSLDSPEDSKGPGKPGWLRFILNPKLLIGLGALIVLAALASGISVIISSHNSNKKQPVSTITVNTQSLDNGTLNKLVTKTAPNQTSTQLTITPDTLFKGNTEVQQTLSADKDVNIGGNLNVKGTTTLQSSAGINGSLAVHGGLSVGGAVTAASLNVGSLGVTTLNLSGNLNFGGHLNPGGAQPSAKASVATSGGSVTIDGNDTAGTVTINVGNGTLVAGEMAIITFHAPFSGVPRVQLTPINAAAANLRYYATRSATLFTIESASTPSAGTQYVFDYLVTQ